MLEIGKNYIIHNDGWSRLCADIRIGQHCTKLWFAVPIQQEQALTIGRADAFVTALLPMAMHGGHDILCHDTLSEQLHYNLTEQLMTTLNGAGQWYRKIAIQAPLTDSAYSSDNKSVGVGFSGGVDSLYSILRHGTDSEYPVTHLSVFNSGVFEGEDYREKYLQQCRKAERFAQENGLQTLPVDSNISEILPERFLDIMSFRNLAFALSVQGFFHIYLLSSAHDASILKLDVHLSSLFDLLLVSSICTEGLKVYLSGCEAKRSEKLKAIADWQPAYRWLHPCTYGLPGETNCGRCKKCVRDMTLLDAYGKLERFSDVFNLADYRKHQAARVGFLLANRGNHLFDEAIAVMEDLDYPIPKAAHIFEKQFLQVMEGQKK